MEKAEICFLARALRIYFPVKPFNPALIRITACNQTGCECMVCTSIPSLMTGLSCPDIGSYTRTFLDLFFEIFGCARQYEQALFLDIFGCARQYEQALFPDIFGCARQLEQALLHSLARKLHSLARKLPSFARHFRARHFNQCIRPTQGVALGYVQYLGLQPAPTICPFGAGNHSARRAYEIRPVVTVVGITIATFANAMLSYVVSVVVNNNPRARQAFSKRPFLLAIS